MNKVLSIIIPTYNMEKYLHKCLDSLIVSDESMEKLEVLVINDGSKDSSSQIGHEYESKYPQTFHIIDKENGNYGSCVNRGLKEATGKYVKVLDADDFFDKRYVNGFVAFLEHVDTDLIVNDYCMVDESGIITDTYTFQLPMDKTFTLDDFPVYMGRWLWHHGITYKLEVVRKGNYRQTEGISYTDDEWILKPMIDVKSVSYFPYALYMYLRGREGQTFDVNVIKRSLKSKVIVAKSMVQFYHDEILTHNREVPAYLYQKLYDRIKTLYNCHLIKYYSEEDNRNLTEFDFFLKNNYPFLYEDLDKIKNKIGICYINYWRNHNYCPHFLSLRLYKLKVFLMNTLHAKDVSTHMSNDLKRK